MRNNEKKAFAIGLLFWVIGLVYFINVVL